MFFLHPPGGWQSFCNMEAPPPLPDSSETAEASPAFGLAGRLVNVFATPGEVFDQVKTARPATANWLVPALIFILVSWVGAWLIFSQDSIRQQLVEATDRAIDQRIQSAHLSPDQAERSREMATKYAGLAQKFVAYAGPPLAGFASPFFWGLVFWLLAGHAFKAGLPYMKAVEVAGLCNMINVLAAILKTLLVLVLGNLFAGPTPAVFLKDFDPQQPLHLLLSLADFTTIWVLALRALGLARLTNARWLKCAGWVFGLWFLYIGWTVGMAALGRAFTRG